MENWSNFLSFCFPFFLRRQNNSFLKKVQTEERLKGPFIVFFLNVSKKVKRLGTPKIGGRGFLISLEKGVTPLETLYQF